MHLFISKLRLGQRPDAGNTVYQTVPEGSGIKADGADNAHTGDHNATGIRIGFHSGFTPKFSTFNNSMCLHHSSDAEIRLISLNRRLPQPLGQ